MGEKFDLEHTVCSSCSLWTGFYTIGTVYTVSELCPPLYSTATTIMKCTDISREEVPCSEASHGTYLSYDCIAYYEAPLGFKKTLTCRDGQWSYNAPVCQPSKLF